MTAGSTPHETSKPMRRKSVTGGPDAALGVWVAKQQWERDLFGRGLPGLLARALCTIQTGRRQFDHAHRSPGLPSLYRLVWLDQPFRKQATENGQLAPEPRQPKLRSRARAVTTVCPETLLTGFGRTRAEL
jgi:hypothetical protein